MLVPFGCFVVRSKETQTPLHAWDLLAKYYESKHGKEFTNSATNKLSQSFSLNVVAGKVITIKQSLLNAVETVLKIHKYDTSNKDSCFKAFVCLALKLVLSSFPFFCPCLFVCLGINIIYFRIISSYRVSCIRNVNTFLFFTLTSNF